MATTTVPGHPTSGMAITSLVLGIVTLLASFVPIFPLLPGVLAIIFGIIGIRQIKHSAAGGKGMAVAGIVCAVLGMIPTLLMVLALIGIGVSGPEIVIDGSGMEAGGPAAVTLQISRNDFFEDTEAYDVGQNTSNISGMSGSSGVESVDFDFSGSNVKYTGKLETTSPKHLAITIELENEVPFKLGIDGINEVSAQENDQPVSLDQPLDPGKHTIKITGVAP